MEQHEPKSCYDKPRGLWVSVDGEENCWRSWCLSESFGLERLTHIHDVKLRPDAHVLVLRGAFGIDAFTQEYGREVPICSWTQVAIDWPAVAARYAGLIITPYVWERRLHDRTSWYYGWDCASGCIWDAAAIASVNLQGIVSVPVRPNAVAA